MQTLLSQSCFLLQVLCSIKQIILQLTLLNIVHYIKITGFNVKFCFLLCLVEKGTAELVVREDGQLVNRNCECCFNCCGGRLMVGWLWVQQVCFAIISEPMFDLFIILCIVLNTGFMTVEHYPQSETFELTLTVANYVSCVFSPYTYWFLSSVTLSPFHWNIKFLNLDLILKVFPFSK